MGALQFQQEGGPLLNSTITSAYDELGRLSGRTVAGAGAEAFQYDAIGRLTGRSNDLGAFTLGYLGQTDQVTTRQLASSTLATTFSYLNNAGDRRLAGIANVGLTAGQFSTFAFTSTPEDFVASVTETADTTAVYPPAGTQTATYNALNQLTNLSSQVLTYDAIGNLTSDGTRTYSWDAESRLVGIGYPGQPGKASAFTYDGLGRRTAIAETPPGGGAAVTKSYLWCGDAICQARDASNATIRGYYDEGEVVPGSPAQPYYYGVDQLGSVRRAFATTSAPAYAYDPYGVPLQVTAPVTDFGYAGLFNHPASGLNLTFYRAYDPVAGRWLSRDPIGEPSDPAANLYAYVAGNTPNLIDPTGQNPILLPMAFGALGAGGASVASQLYSKGCVNWGMVGSAASVGGLTGGAAGGLLAGIFARAAAALAGYRTAQLAAGAAAGINITGGGLAHVLERHAVGGANTAGKSIFSAGENISRLIRDVSSAARVQQSGGNFARVTDAGRAIGIDRATGRPTSIYTVITNAAEDLITAFPGRP